MNSHAAPYGAELYGEVPHLPHILVIGQDENADLYDGKTYIWFFPCIL